jgi:hypothetical protein
MSPGIDKKLGPEAYTEDAPQDSLAKGVPVADEVDYAGAVKATDPAELKLVRKLDYRIMVRNRCSSAQETSHANGLSQLCV